jgi:Cu(I)/Ag(I) efflux system membrane fusion protein
MYAGRDHVVFVDLGDGRFQPRTIETGLRDEDWIEVLDGLSSGESVVTSANFLIAAESKLKSGLDKW